MTLEEVGVGRAEPWECAEMRAGEVLQRGSGSALKRRRKRCDTQGGGSGTDGALGVR